MDNWFEHILFHMRAQPETPAMVMEDRAVTYGMLSVAIERCARRIVALNVAGDAPIAVMVANPIRNMTLSLALHRLGLRSIALVPGQQGIESLTLSAVLADAESMRAIPFGLRAVEVTNAWFGEDVPGTGSPDSFAEASQICRASLTSGSTGTPKLVEHCVADIGQRVAGFGNRNWGFFLCMPGLSSSYGFTAACAVLATARTLCFAESPFQAARMIDLFSIDAMLAAPEQLLAITRVARTSQAQLRSLRTVWVGGTMLTRSLLQSAAVHVCRDIICRYGASETGAMAHADARDVLQDPGFAGYVLPGVEIGIFDDRGGRCADGQTGLIKARRSGNEAWIDLGDIGRLTSGGRLYVLGRASEAGTGCVGQQISPVHEAEHLSRLEWDVADAAAILIEDAANPAMLQIWIGMVDGKSADVGDLSALLRTRGIDHAIRLFDLKAIPRGTNGKVNRAQLKAVMLAETGRPTAV